MEEHTHTDTKRSAERGRELTRRQLLRYAGGFAAMSVCAPILAACGSSSTGATPTTSGTGGAGTGTTPTTGGATQAGSTAPATGASPTATTSTSGATVSTGTTVGPQVTSAGSANNQPIDFLKVSQKVTITVNNGPKENQKQDIKNLNDEISRFEKQAPNITVKWDSNSWDSKTFAAQLAGGRLETAFLVPYTEPGHIIANGQSADITDYLKKWQHYGDMNKQALRVAQDSKGRIYGIPANGGYALGLIYNRQFFKDAGLDPDKPPTTWDELRDMAKKTTTKDHAGYAECSKSNQGGWHFTAWMFTAGSKLEQQEGSKWKATFNDKGNGVEILQWLKDMRWKDDSMTQKQLLDQDALRQMTATGKIAMSVQAPDALPDMANKYKAKMEDFGMGILPQNGGNATLSGGAVWMFNPKASEEEVQAAVEWILWSNFNLRNMENNLKASKAEGNFIGGPEFPLFTGQYQKQREALTVKYANAPTQNYKPYSEGILKLKLKAEPPIETQQMYAALDVPMQGVLTNKGSDPKQLLDQAQQQFQSQVLDRA